MSACHRRAAQDPELKVEYPELTIFHKSRSEDWICYVKWREDQENDPEFKEVLNNVKKNMK